jgi:hypothetical protein
MHLDLTDDEARELRDVLDERLRELRDEIHHADVSTFHDELKERQTRLVALRKKLG